MRRSALTLQKSAWLENANIFRKVLSVWGKSDWLDSGYKGARSPSFSSCSKCRYVNDNYNYNNYEWYCSAVREHLQNEILYNQLWFFCNLYITAQSMLIVESMHFWSNLVPRWVPWLKKTLAARWMTLPQFCSREKTGQSLKALFDNCIDHNYPRTCFSESPENFSGPKTQL